MDGRDRWIVVLWGCLLAAVGVAQVVATTYGLFTVEGPGGGDIAFGFLAGGYAAAIGGLLLAGRLDRHPLVLPPQLWRYWLVLGLFLIGSLQLTVALGEPWSQGTREAPTLMAALGTWLFFAPVHRSDLPVRLTEARRRTWRRSSTALVLAGAAVVGVALLSPLIGTPSWVLHLAPFAAVLLLFAALLHQRLKTLPTATEKTPRAGT